MRCRIYMTGCLIFLRRICMRLGTRPEITEERVEQIKNIIAENPTWNRTKISKHICKLWGWQSPKTPSRTSGNSDKVKHLNHDMTPICAKLSELRPLQINIVSSGKELMLFKSLIDQYHYLRYDRTVGENMKYMIYSCDGRPLSCLLFGSAAWSCRVRDNFIGWNKSERMRGLSLITNNSRFLIAPWVKVEHLASHILSLVVRRIANDWQHKYGHPVYCLETYVEIDRFRGTCYQAANWIHVGRTTGRGRDGGHHNAILPIKDVYLYPLTSQYKKILYGMER